MSAKPVARQWPWTVGEILQELALTVELLTVHRNPAPDFRTKLIDALVVKIGLVTDMCSQTVTQLVKALNLSPLTAEEKQLLQTAIDTKFINDDEFSSLQLVKHCNTQQLLCSPNLYLNHICTQHSCFDRACSNNQNMPAPQQQNNNNTAI